MIELMLALGVCVIDICGVMVLIPIGTNASRDAAMETYAANAADQMLHLLKLQLTNDADANSWTAKITGPEALPLSNPASANENLKHDDADWNSVAEVDMENVFAYNSPGIYQIISDRGATVSLSSSEIDFRAIIFVWRSDISLSGGVVPQHIGITLNTEVTWPAELPYSARQKAHYVLEVFNPK